MHFDSMDGVRFAIEDDVPRITDADGDEYQVLTPPVGHPYCKKAEDGFTVAHYSGAWKERLMDVSILMHLRRKRDLSFRDAFFKADLAVKALGVETAIIDSPDHLLRGFICTPPTEVSPHAIVVRPFSPSNIGASLVHRAGDVHWSLDELRANPFPLSMGMDHWERGDDSGKVNVPFPSLGREAVLSSTERMKLFDQTKITLGTSSPTGEVSLQVPEGDSGILKGRLFLVAESGVRWLVFPNTEVPGNRRGLSMTGTELRASFFESVVEGSIRTNDSGFSFFPERPVQWTLPHLWALKEA